VTQIRICPKCEKSCSLQIDYQGSELLSVTGHRCHLGVEFAESLFGPPLKIVSASVTVKGGIYPSVPVRTSKKIAPELVMAVIKAANQLSVEAPIRNGQVIARNIANSGAELIATRQVEKA